MCYAGSNEGGGVVKVERRERGDNLAEKRVRGTDECGWGTGLVV